MVKCLMVGWKDKSTMVSALCCNFLTIYHFWVPETHPMKNNESQTKTNEYHLSTTWIHTLLLCFVLFVSATIINGGLWRALHSACLIPDLIWPHSQGPLDIKIHTHLMTNKHGSIWNRSNLLINLLICDSVKAWIFFLKNYF